MPAREKEGKEKLDLRNVCLTPQAIQGRKRIFSFLVSPLAGVATQSSEKEQQPVSEKSLPAMVQSNAGGGTDSGKSIKPKKHTSTANLPRPVCSETMPSDEALPLSPAKPTSHS